MRSWRCRRWRQSARALAGRQLIVAATPGVAPLFEEITARVRRMRPSSSTSAMRRRTAGAAGRRRVLLTNSFRTAWVSRHAADSAALGLPRARALAAADAGRPAAAGPVHQSELPPSSHWGFGGLTAPSASEAAGSDTELPQGLIGPPIGSPATRARIDAFLAQLGVDRARPARRPRTRRRVRPRQALAARARRRARRAAERRRRLLLLVGAQRRPRRRP